MEINTVIFFLLLCSKQLLMPSVRRNRVAAAKLSLPEVFRQNLTNFTDLKWEKAAFDPSGPASVYLACRDCHPHALLNQRLSHVSSQLSCD